MTEELNARYRRVDQPYLWGVPSALAIGAFLVLLCLIFLDRRQLGVALGVSLAAVATLWWTHLSRAGDSVEVTSSEYIVARRRAEASRFDSTSISDMRWQFIPYSGAVLTLVNEQGSTDIPVSRDDEHRSRLPVLQSRKPTLVAVTETCAR